MNIALKLLLATSLAFAFAIVPGMIAAESRHRALVTLPPSVRPLEAPGLHNFFAVGTNVYSGSSPGGEEAFAALATVGVKTIVTVDGAKPNVAAARKYGIRYVHLPHGYDGMHTNLQLQLAKLGDSLPGPIYVHCHHGKHRGPTAAAVICIANSGWTAAQAEAWLIVAGTATNYVGLYGVVRTFHKPSAEQLRATPATFLETAKVSGLVDAMVEMDERWDRVKAVRAANYGVPKQHPDIKPAHEAVILWEHYREAQRMPEAFHRGADFIARLKGAETEAREAERLLELFASEPKPETHAQLDKVFDAMAKSCVSCHKTYRDPAGIAARQWPSYLSRNSR